MSSAALVGRLARRFPSEGTGFWQFCRRVTAATDAPREVGCSTECCERRRSPAVGLPVSRHELAVSDRPTVFPRRRPPCLDGSGSSSRELRLFFRVHSCLSPASMPGSIEAPPLGSSSPSRHRPAESTLDEVPASSSFRPQRFSRSRRFPPPLASWACFIPLPRPGFTLQGFLPAAQPFPPRRWTVPSCRLVLCTCREPKLSAPVAEYPASRAFFQAAIRCVTQVV